MDVARAKTERAPQAPAPAGATAAPVAGSSSPPIRVLTLNAHRGFSAFGRRNVLTQMRNALRMAGADVVFLQEVGGDDEALQRSHEYEVLADGVWHQHAYGRNAVVSGGHQGNALLSKYPIHASHNVDVSVADAEPRGLLHCVLDLPHGRHLHAICVHFGLQESHRSRQLELLLGLVELRIPAEAPVVIAGDFNDWRGRAHRRLQATAFQEVSAAASGRPARTFPARWPLLRLDRIYVRNARHRPWPLAPRDWANLSDHAPLGGEVRV